MMSFLSKKSGKDSPLLSDSISDAGSTYDAMKQDMQGPDVPTWVNDDDADECFLCDDKFSFSSRRHHCRRCRSVFCEKCTTKKSKILILAITEMARVCEECFHDLPNENSYIDTHKPILLKGATFQKKGCCSSNFITMKLEADGKILMITEDKKKSVAWDAAEIQNITASSASSFLVLYDDQSINFLCETEEDSVAWVDALKALVRVCREPTLHDKVARIRRQKIENAKKAALAEERNADYVKELNERKKSREEIRARSSSKGSSTGRPSA
jgi:hypothetical protein